MRALVTGASGFCGRHLLKYLNSQGVEVYSVGNKLVGTNHYLADITNLDRLTKIIDEVRPNYIFHLAGVVNSENPMLYYQINSGVAATILQALDNTNQTYCPVLLVGTAAEYGMITQKQLPITEDTPTQPYNHYGISKLAQTIEGQVFSKKGRPIVIVRPFNIIGSRMPDYLAVQNFVRQLVDILQGDQPPIIEVGNLSSSRDFVDVNDVVKCYWQLIQKPTAYGEIINICSGKAVVMAELLEKLITFSDAQVEVQVRPNLFKPIDVPVHFGNPEKLERLLGYRFNTSLDQTLHQILEEAIKSK